MRLFRLEIIAPILAFLALWELVVRINNIPDYLLPAPSLIFQTLLSDGPSLLPSLLVTVKLIYFSLLQVVLGGAVLKAGAKIDEWLLADQGWNTYSCILQSKDKMIKEKKDVGQALQIRPGLGGTTTFKEATARLKWPSTEQTEMKSSITGSGKPNRLRRWEFAMLVIL